MIKKLRIFLVYFLVFSFTLLLESKTKAYTEPVLNLNIPSQPKIGDTMTIGVGAMYFDEEESDRIGYSYYINGFPGGGLVAGSNDRFIKDGRLGNKYGNLKYIDYESGGHKIRYWYRTIFNSKGEEKEPGEENDNDVNRNKIHDDWERKYFGIDPNTNSVDPDADPDGDGYAWLKRMGDIHGGCMVAPTSMPDLFQCGVFGFPGGLCLLKALFDAGIPQTADVTGPPPQIVNPLSPRYGIGIDEKFSNYEEYVFGTNPQMADTDGDGILDEADVIGLNQNKCSFEITPALGPAGKKIPIEVTTLGYVPEGNGNFHPWRHMEMGFNHSCLFLLKKEASIVVSPGPPLDIVLQSEPKVPTPANTGTDYPEVKVEASVTGMEDLQRLYFKWYIGTKVIDEGYGKNKFSFPVKANPCDIVSVTCDVSERSPGGVVRSGSKSLDIPIGYNIPEDRLSASLLYNTSQDQDNDGCIDGDTNCNFILEGGETWTTIDPFHDQINSGLLANGREVRQNDVIVIDTNFSSGNGLCTCPPHCESDEAKDFIYTWYLDGKEQTDQSGAGNKPNPEIEGKTCQSFKFTVTKPPGDTHLVKLKLTRISDGFEYGQLGEKVFTVQSPTSSITAGLAGGCDEVVYETGACRIILNPGDKKSVTFKTTLENFQPTFAPSFHYIWTFDGEVQTTGVDCGGTVGPEYCESTQAESTLTYEFAHPGNITEETRKTHSVGLTVENYTTASGGPTETTTDTYPIEVVLKPTTTQAQGPLIRLFAQAGQAVSSYFKNIFNLVLSLGIIGFIIFVVMAVGEIRKQKF